MKQITKSLLLVVILFGYTNSSIADSDRDDHRCIDGICLGDHIDVLRDKSLTYEFVVYQNQELNYSKSAWITPNGTLIDIITLGSGTLDDEMISLFGSVSLICNSDYVVARRDYEIRQSTDTVQVLLIELRPPVSPTAEWQGLQISRIQKVYMVERKDRLEWEKSVSNAHPYATKCGFVNDRGECHAGRSGPNTFYGHGGIGQFRKYSSWIVVQDEHYSDHQAEIDASTTRMNIFQGKLGCPSIQAMR